MNLSNKIIIKRNQDKSLTKQLEEQLATLIESNYFEDDSRLPAAKTLAEQTGVAYITMETALKQLAQRGLIKRTPRGSFVCQQFTSPKKKNIAIVFWNSAERDRLYKRRVMEGIKGVLDESRYSITVLLENECRDNGIDWWIEAGCSNKYDAVILDKEGTYDAEAMRLLKNSKVPCLLFNSVMDNLYDITVRVMPDFSQGVYELTEHLCNLNHKRIAMLLRKNDFGPDNIFENTWRNTLEMNDISPRDEYLFRGLEHDQELIAKSIESLLNEKERPTAIVCGDDIIAYHTVCLLLKKGLKVPDDISVSGFNGFDVTEIMNPKLTTVHIPLYGMGRVIGTKLIQILAGKLKKELHFIPLKMVPGESTGICPE